MGEFNLSYHVFKDYNIVFDEYRNYFGSLRLVQWVKEGSEPDINKAKLEIRKIQTKDSGEELCKGYTFSTEEGPHELAESLVDIGFGNTKKIIKSISKREDFKESIDTINDDPDKDSANDSIFDMRNLLIMDNEDEEE